MRMDTNNQNHWLSKDPEKMYNFSPKESVESMQSTGEELNLGSTMITWGRLFRVVIPVSIPVIARFVLQGVLVADRFDVGAASLYCNSDHHIPHYLASLRKRRLSVAYT